MTRCHLDLLSLLSTHLNVWRTTDTAVDCCHCLVDFLPLFSTQPNAPRGLLYLERVEDWRWEKVGEGRERADGGTEGDGGRRGKERGKVRDRGTETGKETAVNAVLGRQRKFPKY